MNAENKRPADANIQKPEAFRCFFLNYRKRALQIWQQSTAELPSLEKSRRNVGEPASRRICQQPIGKLLSPEKSQSNAVVSSLSEIQQKASVKFNLDQCPEAPVWESPFILSWSRSMTQEDLPDWRCQFSTFNLDQMGFKIHRRQAKWGE